MIVNRRFQLGRYRLYIRPRGHWRTKAHPWFYFRRYFAGGGTLQIMRLEIFAFPPYVFS